MAVPFRMFAVGSDGEFEPYQTDGQNKYNSGGFQKELPRFKLANKSIRPRTFSYTSEEGLLL